MRPRYVTGLAEAQNHRCCYCQCPVDHAVQPHNIRTALTKDHYHPRCYGGPTTPENLVIACAQCNQIRGSLDAETFYTVIQAWFKKDPGLQARWHTISSAEFGAFRHECIIMDQKRWQRSIKKCIAARILHSTFPIVHHSQRT